MKCRNCKENLTMTRIPFCVACRWMGGKGMAAGGFVVGAIWALIEFFSKR
jgi:hypothetical protein